MFRLFRSKSKDRRSAAPALPSEQRRHRRHVIRLDATIYSLDVYQDVNIVGATPTGVIGEGSDDLAPGQLLHVSFGNTYYPGVVRWTKGAQFGLDVDEDIEVPGLRRTDARTQAGQPARAERIRLDLPARLHIGQSSRPALIRDLSRQGMAVETKPGLLAGQQVLVRAGSYPLIPGKVRWASERRLGIAASVEMPLLQMLYSE